MGQLVTSYYK